MTTKMIYLERYKSNNYPRSEEHECNDQPYHAPDCTDHVKMTEIAQQ